MCVYVYVAQRNFFCSFVLLSVSNVWRSSREAAFSLSWFIILISDLSQLFLPDLSAGTGTFQTENELFRLSELGHDAFSRYLWKDHDDGWPQQPREPPQMQTGVLFMEYNDNAEHLGEPEQEEYHQNEGRECLGCLLYRSYLMQRVWASFCRGVISCQVAR